MELKNILDQSIADGGSDIFIVAGRQTSDA